MCAPFWLSKSATSTALDASELALLLFGVLLVVGLIGEYAKSERWKKHVRAFEMFVILGVAGELLADGGIFLFSRHLQTIADLEIAALTQKAGDAKISADGAAFAASRAKSSADEASIVADNVAKQADALTLRMGSASRKLGSLEEQLRVQGPRWRLLKDNKDAFIEALKPFAGQRVTVVSCGLMVAPESYNLEQNLLIFLGKQGAGWELGYTTWKSCTNGASSVGGNLLICSSTASEAVKDSANALGNILNKLEISTIAAQSTPEGRQLELQFLGADSPWELAAKDTTAVILLVGTNPMFDLAGWKKRNK
jgi:hypothetical protein